MELPDVLERGERSRLFPVLADTSKEGRTLSIFLSCLQSVDEFGASILASIGQRPGTRARIETYTEVVLKKGGEKAHRPDGLIVVKNGSKQWMALVEAKVGGSELTPEQVESYLELAKLNGIDAMLTLSNQFASLPTHHPVPLSATARKKAELFHCSWMFVVTQASLLVSNEQVASPDQRFLLNEMVRFLMHPSAGVKSFEQMPASWPELVSKVQTGAKLSATSPDVREVAGAWHQEMRDLSLILSRQLSTEVSTRISRTHAADPTARLRDAVVDLAKEECLTGTLVVPAAASPIDVCADLQKRSVTVSMKLKAPAERKGAKGRISWLLRQIQRTDGRDIHLRLFWPGRAADSQYPLALLRENPDLPLTERPGLVVSSFEVLLVRDCGARFGQRRNFITELEAAVPEFYEQVGQYLKAWRAPPPRIPEGKTEPTSVDTAALREAAEEAVADQDD
ncbi:MAG: hypothetical protein WD942_09745 [Dehalococcoidia bacterium]